MSRVGRAPIAVPAGVEVSIAGQHISVKGSKGTLERDIPGEITKADKFNCINTAGARNVWKQWHQECFF